MTSHTKISPSNHETSQPPETVSAGGGGLELTPTWRPFSPTAEKGRTISISLVMRPLLKLGGLIGLVLKRQRHHPGLTLLALLGVVLAVGLVSNASLFSQAVEQAILDQRLAEFSRMTGRPAFSVGVYTFPSSRQPISLEAAEEVARHVADTLSSEVGLPLKHVGLWVGSGGMMLQPREGSNLYGEEQSYLDSVDLVYMAGIGEHLETVAGEPLNEGASGEVLDVWMHTRLAEKMGVHIGDEFTVGVTLIADSVPISVRGFWQARDPADPFWFTDPDQTLKNTLLVRRRDYITHMEPLLSSKTRVANWHVILDDSKVIAEDARSYISGFERGLAVINKYLPGAKLNSPPLDSLGEFVQREITLTTLLLSFNVPAFGFLLYFLILASVIIARWQRQDTATLVSRGMSMAGILGLTLIEEFLLFVVGYPLGIGFGMLLARLMGYTSSFLSFVPRSPLSISLRGVSVPLTLVALAVTLIARLWPAAQATRQSVVEAERERARPLRGPFWYRYYLDLLLLLPTAYAYRQLADQGTLALLVHDRPEDLYRDPLLILVPALFILTAALMTLRAFPLVMRVIDGLVGVIPWTTPYLALRRLSRQSQGYVNPLLLIIVSLALGVYTLSMAASLDRWLIDRMYYQVGADLAFEPSLLSAAETGSSDESWPALDPSSIPLPSEFRDLPGVMAASRVGDYYMSIDLAGGDEINGRFLAIDRLDFPSVTWFRYDFANESLGALMNRLALLPDGILVSEQFLNESLFQVGNKITLEIAVNDELGTVSPFTVAGTYKYFPTVYEEDRVAVIGNLDHLSNLMGTPLPHHIWLRIQDDADGQAVLKAVSKTGVDAVRRRDARALIAEEQAKTERVGVFGTLSVGFLAAVVMAAMGLLIYNYASLQERLFRFAVLRAVGLRYWQIVGQVVLEYGLLTAWGAAVGALVGIAASELFVPFFRVTGEQRTPLPPLLPVIAQQDISRLAVIFVGIMILMGAIVIARALSRRHFAMLRGHWG
jgi:putative ABC transport system permease protein